jgi:NADH-quinone oxidoreductase subunit K
MMMMALGLAFAAWASLLGAESNMRLLFALFVIAAAAAESVLGLAIILAIYRRRGVANADEMDLLKK